ncbi:MAG: DUF1501 domain-containing protein [Flavobacteriales bacterium]|nr:DUF1501 domain-containing protein [Flavobacteriales bacterium]
MNRRSFLRTSALASVGGLVLRGWAKPALAPYLKAASNGDRVLVVVQLFGGNDGLNTVIPLDQYSLLSGMRSNILIPEASTLALQGTGGATALHPSLTGFQQLWDEGKLGIVQSVGYPDPNLSHFRSTDIWETGSSGNQLLTDGWLGRYLGTLYPDFPTGYPNVDVPDPIAIRVGGNVSLGLQAHGVAMATAVNNTEDVLNLAGNMFIDPVLPGCSGDKLDFIRNVQRQTDLYGDVIEAAAADVTCVHSSLYPTGSQPGATLANALKIVASLICGGLGTRIYWVSDTGFDTHSQQVVNGNPLQGAHANLLKGVGDAIYAFQDDLQQLGIADRVLGMTFSEFGRRIKSNNSLGTDHGAAAPMFFFGDHVQPGILGTNPQIDPNTDGQTNVPMQYDFRSVYASVLKDWFCLDADDIEQVLLGPHATLPILDPSYCATLGVPTLAAADLLLQASPNPFSERTTVTYTCVVPGHVVLQVFNAQGQLVAMPVNEKRAPGTYKLDLDLGPMPNGVYYCRLQNGQHQVVRNMVKAR